MPDSAFLFALVGHMKVEQLAHVVGLGIEDVVAAILGGPRNRRARPPERAVATHEAAPPSRLGGEPPLAAMLGRASYHEVHRAIDRWLLARVLDEERGNVSHAAGRLRVSRRTLRERWARVRDRPDGAGSWTDEPPDPVSAAAPPSLTELLDQRRTYAEIRDAVDLWLIGGTLTREGGNVSRTARSLGIVRKQVRERWSRVRPK
jgi:DNA-binding NtrC family response regulator